MLFPNIDTFCKSIDASPENYAVLPFKDNETSDINFKIIDLATHTIAGTLPQDYSGPISKIINKPQLVLKGDLEAPVIQYDNYKENMFYSFSIDDKGINYLQTKLLRALHENPSDGEVKEEDLPNITKTTQHYKELAKEIESKAFCIFGNSSIDNANLIILPDLNHSEAALPEKRAYITDSIPEGKFTSGRIFLLEGADQSDIFTNSLIGTHEVFNIDPTKDNIAFWDDQVLIEKHEKVASKLLVANELSSKPFDELSEKDKVKLDKLREEGFDNILAKDRELTHQRTQKILEAINNWQAILNDNGRIFIIGGADHLIDKQLLNGLFQKAISFAIICTAHKAGYEMTEEDKEAREKFEQKIKNCTD